MNDYMGRPITDDDVKNAIKLKCEQYPHKARFDALRSCLRPDNWRQLDHVLQRLRRNGEIVYTTRDGWKVVPAAPEAF